MKCFCLPFIYLKGLKGMMTGKFTMKSQQFWCHSVSVIFYTCSKRIVCILNSQADCHIDSHISFFEFCNIYSFSASPIPCNLRLLHSNWQRQKLFLYAFIHWARKQKWQTLFVFLTDKLSFKSRHVIIKWSWKPLYIVFTACSVLKSSDNVNCFNILQSWSFMNHDDAEKHSRAR